MEVPASSAAACAAFSAAVAARFWVSGSGGPAFCIAGFGRDLACRRASSTAGSMGRESACRTGASGRGARPLFQGRKRIAMQISAAPIKNSKSQRRAPRFSGENIICRSCERNTVVVNSVDALDTITPAGFAGRSCSPSQLLFPLGRLTERGQPCVLSYRLVHDTCIAAP